MRDDRIPNVVRVGAIFWLPKRGEIYGWPSFERAYESTRTQRARRVGTDKPTLIARVNRI